jgi:hypothetical protein
MRTQSLKCAVRKIGAGNVERERRVYYLTDRCCHPGPSFNWEGLFIETLAMGKTA